jgi:hypothetical protein
MERIDEYASISNSKPEQLYWQVSLLSAGGELVRFHGSLSDTKSMYLECAGRDVNRVLAELSCYGG